MIGFKKSPRRDPVELQLTAMIDIFSIIIIFLILGTVFGAADIPLPKDLSLPFSQNEETVENASRVTIHQDYVEIAVLDNKKIPLSAFNARSIPSLKAELVGYLSSIDKKNRSSAKQLNIVADKETAYGDLFPVVRFFRSAGFESVMFIASSELSQGSL